MNEQGWSAAKVADAQEVSKPTARKWARRHAAEGELGLLDRPSAANHVWNRTPEDRIEAICALRRLRFTGAELAELFRMPETTVSGIHHPGRAGPSRQVGPRAAPPLRAPAPRRARPRRCQEARPDRARRRQALHRTPALEAVMTDNGSAYRSAIHSLACRALGLKHLRTRPRRPQTNGKAERFIRTMLGGWA